MKNTFSAQDAVLPAYFPSVLYRALIEAGYREADLLQGTNLSTEMFFDDHVRFSFVQHRRFIRNAINVTGDPHLGIHFGQQIHVTSLGILGYAAMSCNTLESALETITRYFKIRAPLLELSLLRESSQVAIQIDEALEFGDLRYFLLSSAMCGIERVLDYYVGQKGVVSRATMVCPEPEDWSDVAPSVGFPVVFNQSFTRIYFPHNFLAYRLAMADPQTEQSTKAICEQLLARVSEQAGIVSRVRRCVLEYPGHCPSLGEVAAYLCVSSRTLRRELQKAGATYQKVLDKVRENIALEYLTTTRKPIYEIAMELGFNDLSSFGRAFRRWTGRSPNSFRKQHLF